MKSSGEIWSRANKSFVPSLLLVSLVSQGKLLVIVDRYSICVIQNRNGYRCKVLFAARDVTSLTLPSKQEFHFQFSTNFHFFSYISSNFPHFCSHFGRRVGDPWATPLFLTPVGSSEDLHLHFHNLRVFRPIILSTSSCRWLTRRTWRSHLLLVDLNLNKLEVLVCSSVHTSTIKTMSGLRFMIATCTRKVPLTLRSAVKKTLTFINNFLNILIFW